MSAVNAERISKAASKNKRLKTRAELAIKNIQAKN